MDVLITPIERRGRPGPCRVLPFSLCQKTVGARFCGRARRLRETLHTMVQPQYIRLSVFPTTTHHGIKIRLLKARVAPVPRSVVMPLTLAPDRASFVVRPASLMDERRVLGQRAMADARSEESLVGKDGRSWWRSGGSEE